MPISNQPEYPPLLAVGFHPMTLQELRDLCVGAFATSTTRLTIMTGLELVFHEMSQAGIQADVWVDGSFLTQKIDPNDVDIVVCVESDFLDNCTSDQTNVLNWIKGNLKASHYCDSYILCRFPNGHPNQSLGEWMHAYWVRQFGFGRQDGIKGVAVVTV